MLRSLIIIPLLLAGAVARADAQSSSPAPGFVTGQIGIAVFNLPRYPGSDERWTVPLPIVDLRIANRIYLGGGVGGLSGGAGIYLVEAKGFSWTADLSLMPDRPEDRTDALAGMGDRGFGVFGGSTVAYRLGPMQASASVALGLEDRMGLLGMAGLSFGQRLGNRWFGQVGGLAVFSDCTNMRWDFGISERQAERRRDLLSGGASGLEPGDDQAFSPECGLRELRATGVASYALSTRLSAVATGTGIRYQNGAAASPLTRHRTTWEAGVGLAWRF